MEGRNIILQEIIPEIVNLINKNKKRRALKILKKNIYRFRSNKSNKNFDLLLLMILDNVKINKNK